MRSGKMDGYDAVFLSPHKFLGGPGTPGIVLMSKALYRLRSSAPSTCGGGTVAYVNGFSEKVKKKQLKPSYFEINYPCFPLINLLVISHLFSVQFLIYKKESNSNHKTTPIT